MIYNWICPLEIFWNLNVKLMSYVYRTNFFTPSAESVVGNDNVNIVIFYDGFNIMMFSFKIF